MSCSQSRWQGWRIAARRAACRFAPVPGGDQEHPPARPTTAKTQPQQPPTQLPLQKSDILPPGNPPCNLPPHFAPHVWQDGLNNGNAEALNSPDRQPDTVGARQCGKTAIIGARTLSMDPSSSSCTWTVNGSVTC